MAQERFEAPWQEVAWGATSDEIAAHFGARARRLEKPLDFGDSYVDVVLREVRFGSYTLIAFFQMDKKTRRLKRVQLERQRHGVNPPVALSVWHALEDTYGPPDKECDAAPRGDNGYQRTGERVWLRDGNTIRLVVREMLFDPQAGCAYGGGAIFGQCGLPSQILVRVSPTGAAAKCR